jgi:hypothetical protein
MVSPQGSVLGSLFYILYSADLIDIISEQGVTPHSHADDMQIYVSIPADETVRAAQQFAVCDARVNQWLASNQLNADKTQAV